MTDSCDSCPLSLPLIFQSGEWGVVESNNGNDQPRDCRHHCTWIMTLQLLSRWYLFSLFKESVISPLRAWLSIDSDWMVTSIWFDLTITWCWPFQTLTFFRRTHLAPVVVAHFAAIHHICVIKYRKENELTMEHKVQLKHWDFLGRNAPVIGPKCKQKMYTHTHTHIYTPVTL